MGPLKKRRVAKGTDMNFVFIFVFIGNVSGVVSKELSRSALSD